MPTKDHFLVHKDVKSLRFPILKRTFKEKVAIKNRNIAGIFWKSLIDVTRC